MTYLSDSHMWPALSLVFALSAAACCLYVLVLGAYRIAANLRLAVQAPDVPGGVTRLQTGPAILRGRVRTLDGGTAMRVEIDQIGAERQNKNNWSHTWTETERRVQSNPFSLVLDDGKVVEIAADKDTFLVDALDAGRRLQAAVRRRTAELSLNEHVYCVGELRLGAPDFSARASTFREPSAAGYRMVAPRGGQLLIASEPLPARYYARARWHTGQLVWSVIFSAAVALLFAPYVARALIGKHAEFFIGGKRYYVTGSRKSRTSHFHLSGIRTDTNEGIEEDASRGTYDRVKPHDRIPVIYLDGWPKLMQLGARATSNSYFAALGLLIALLRMMTWRASRVRSRPWYAQRPLIEHGAGRLVNT